MAKEEETEETFSEHVNVWQDMLTECATNTEKGTVSQSVPSTLVLLGDKRCGKSEFLNKFQGRVSVPETPEYILDYSYINVKNKHIQDRTAILSRMGVWSLDDPVHSDLVVKLCGPLSHTMYGICIDLSKPETALDQLTKWLAVLEEINGKLLTRLAVDQQQELKKKISKHIQFYNAEDAVVESAAEGGDKSTISGIGSVAAEEPDVIEIKEEVEVEIDMTTPKNNLGVPLFVVGLKADAFTRINKVGADAKFEYLSQQIRKVCLDWGATLIFTSAVGDGINIDPLQDYIFSRVFDFPITEAPKAVSSADDFGLYLPAGYDSAILLEGGSSTYAEGTAMSEVFEAKSVNKEVKAETLVTAESSADFYSSLKDQLASGKPSQRSAASGAKTGGKQEAAKKFFKSLLNGSGSSESRAEVQEALGM